MARGTRIRLCAKRTREKISRNETITKKNLTKLANVRFFLYICKLFEITLIFEA